MTTKWNPYYFMTANQIREYDRIAMETFKIPGPVLMETAGARTAEKILSSGRCTGRVIVVSGTGNNGGDGFVIARHLINAGCLATVCITAPEDQIRGDARGPFITLQKMNADVFQITPDNLPEFEARLTHSRVVVDAILGTGATRPMDSDLCRIVRAINATSAFVISVDIPSGVHPDSGGLLGEAVQADLTTTYGHLKRGLLLYPGAAHAGDIDVIPIGVPSVASTDAGIDGEVLSEDLLRPHFPQRNRNAHKGTCGHLGVVAGSLGKTGAALITGQAALRTGAGLVSIGTTADAHAVISAGSLELMVDCLLESTTHELSAGHTRHLDAFLRGKTALAIGPGLTTATGVTELMIRLLRATTVPSIIDADGVRILAENLDILKTIRNPLIVTPHPGEMACLAGISTSQVESDRPGIAREVAASYGVTVVLKGAHTIVAVPDGRIFLNPTGNPGMATAGMGDALTGIIGGLLAQGTEPLFAALLGIFLHGQCADRCAATSGHTGLITSDVIRHLPSLLKEWESPKMR